MPLFAAVTDGLGRLIPPVAALCLLASAASAQLADPPAVTYPTLPATAANAKGFVPNGWRLEARATGDLDGDGKADLAFVIHDADKRNVLPNPDGIGDNPFDTNPRILAVAFGAGAGQPYRLALQNSTLIPRRDNPGMDDPFDAKQGLSIARGALNVKLSLFMNAGGTTIYDNRFTFRRQGGQFMLIGFDQALAERNTGQVTSTSVNYATGKVRIETGKSGSARQKRTDRSLPKKPLLTIEQVGDGLEFDPGVS